MFITTREFANLYKPSLVNQVYKLMFMSGLDEQPKDSHLVVKEMKKANITFEIVENVEDIVRMMNIANRMVKDESFPFGKNNFYERKTRFIKCVLRTHPDMVREIRESESLYNFIIGGFSFHQPKYKYPDDNFNTTPEDYSPCGITMEYDRDMYLKCMVSISFYLAKHH